MKKYIMMLLVALLPITSSFAQTKQDSIAAYNELKEWAVVKLTIGYIEDYKQWTPNTANGKSKQEFETYNSLIRSYGSFSDEDIDLNDVAKELSNGSWKKTRENVFDNYRSQLIDNEGVSDFGSLSLYDKGLKKGTINTKQALEDIKGKFDSIIQESIIQEGENVQIIKDVNSKKPEVAVQQYRNNVHPKKRESNNMFIYILGGLLIASLIMNVILLKAKKEVKSLKKKISERDKKYEDLEKEKNSLFYNSQRNNNRANNNSEIENLKKDNESLKKEIQELREKLDNSLNNTSEQVTENPTVVEFDNTELSKPTQIIYLPRPQEEKLFLNKHAKNVKDERYLYEVDFNTVTKEGALKLIEDADFARALNSPERYLEKACIYDNEYSHNARQVKVTEEGEIRLEGDNWIVTKKVRIKFV